MHLFVLSSFQFGVQVIWLFGKVKYVCFPAMQVVKMIGCRVSLSLSLCIAKICIFRRLGMLCISHAGWCPKSLWLFGWVLEIRPWNMTVFVWALCARHAVWIKWSQPSGSTQSLQHVVAAGTCTWTCCALAVCTLHCAHCWNWESNFACSWHLLRMYTFNHC